jgi:hypothetical protein
MAHVKKRGESQLKTVFKMTDIEIILSACPGMNIEDARAMLVARSRTDKKIADRASRVVDPKTIHVPAHSRWTHSLVKPAKRVTSKSADHTSRLSNSRTDSKAMKEFLANGGTITVLPTRNAKGSKAQRIRVGSSIVKSVSKQRAAHTKQDRNARALRS